MVLTLIPTRTEDIIIIIIISITIIISKWHNVRYRIRKIYIIL